MIDYMVKPQEVLVTIDESGDLEQEVVEDSEMRELFETMRETLIFLTNQNPGEAEQIFQHRLEQLKQDKSFFTYDRLNKLCWALGSISGCLNRQEEERFVIQVIKELLNLCEKTEGKSNKAQVATDIMYVTSQFPNFLVTHWPFLKTVINKLNEFMREKHPGVQDMAAETFLKISKLTKHEFIKLHPMDKDSEIFLNHLIKQLPKLLADLQLHQVLNVYEGLGWMMSAEIDEGTQVTYINGVLQYVQKEFQGIIAAAEQNSQLLNARENIRTIDKYLKVNHRIADSVGANYVHYLLQVFDTLIKVYSYYS